MEYTQSSCSCCEGGEKEDTAVSGRDSTSFTSLGGDFGLAATGNGPTGFTPCSTPARPAGFGNGFDRSAATTEIEAETGITPEIVTVKAPPRTNMCRRSCTSSCQCGIESSVYIEEVIEDKRQSEEAWDNTNNARSSQEEGKRTAEKISESRIAAQSLRMQSLGRE